MASTDLVQYTGVTVSIAPDDGAGAPGTYVPIARITSADVDDSFSINDIDDFDTAATAIVDRILSNRSVSVSFGVNLVIGDPGYQAIKTEYDGGNRCFIQLLAVDTEASANTYTLELGGYVSGMPKSFAKPIATGNVTFAADEIVSDTIT